MPNHGDATLPAHWGPPYLLYLGNPADDLAIKTARGVAWWRPEWCVGQYRHPDCKLTLGLPDIGMAEARARGANTMMIGTANAGGVMAPEIVADAIAALDAGLNVVAGLHQKLRGNPDIVAAAQRNGRVLFDARDPAPGIPVGTGRPRAGRRLLTVGTDCSVGKKYTALALEKEMRAQGLDADFRATGQTGIFISGRGVAVDAVVADFISGAAEWISPDADPGHWDVVEGQGSLFHPSFAGVTLGLLHGAQPDAFVVCHEPTRTTMRGVPAALPTIRQVIDATIANGRLTNPRIQCVGIAVNTQALDEAAAKACLAEIAAAEGLPTTDPVRFGVAEIVKRVKVLFE